MSRSRSPDRAAAATEIVERGFTVLEGAYAPQSTAPMRDALAERYRQLGSPGTHANPPLEPVEDAEISQVGLVFYKLGGHFPELRPHLLEQSVVEVVRAVLGSDMHLELTSAVLCNGPRPFFPWHGHVGGVDNRRYRKQAIFPRFDRSERVTLLVYLDDLTDEQGALLVHPRRIDDPATPPFDPTAERWPGQVALRCRRGTAVLLEQCTWHAALPKTSPGLRRFLACYFTAREAPPTTWLDDSFASEAGDDLMASVLPPQHSEPSTLRSTEP